MKTRNKRLLILVAVPLFTVTACLLMVQALKNVSPAAVPWLFFCGVCITPLVVALGTFSLVMNFARRTPRLEVTTHVDDLERRHTVLDLSAVTRDEARALRRDETEE